MTNVSRFDPFSDLRQTMDQLFDQGFSRPWRLLENSENQGAGFPVEISETNEGIRVKAALPGVRPEDVEITVANDVLTIRAQHMEETEDQQRTYYRREMAYGGLNRSFSLPTSVDSDRAEAKFDNGMLVLFLPKAESMRPKQIKIGHTNGTAALSSA